MTFLNVEVVQLSIGTEKYASWTLTRKGWMYNHFFGEAQDPEECVIIGNIFDNPELKHKYDKNEEK